MGRHPRSADGRSMVRANGRTAKQPDDGGGGGVRSHPSRWDARQRARFSYDSQVVVEGLIDLLADHVGRTPSVEDVSSARVIPVNRPLPATGHTAVSHPPTTRSSIIATPHRVYDEPSQERSDLAIPLRAQADLVRVIDGSSSAVLTASKRLNAPVREHEREARRPRSSTWHAGFGVADE